VQSAVLRLHVVRPSVHLSVRPSVTLEDQNHVGWKSWKLVAGTIIPNTFALCSPKAIPYSQGTCRIWGRPEVGWGKNDVLEHNNDNIFETCKCRGKGTMEGLYRNSPTLFRTVPSPTPYSLLFPKIGVRNPTPKTKSPIVIISRTGEATDFKCGRFIHSSIRTKFR